MFWFWSHILRVLWLEIVQGCRHTKAELNVGGGRVRCYDSRGRGLVTILRAIRAVRAVVNNSGGVASK